MGLLGVDCGPVRPPLRNLDPAAIASLKQQLQDTGFLGSTPGKDQDRHPVQWFGALC